MIRRASTRGVNQVSDFLNSSQYNTVVNAMSYVGYKTLYSPYLSNEAAVNAESRYYTTVAFKSFCIFLLAFSLYIGFFLKRKKLIFLYGFFLLAVTLLLVSNIFLQEKVLLLSRFSILAGFRNVFNKLSIPLQLLSSFLLTFTFIEFKTRYQKLYRTIVLVIFVIFSLPFFISTPVYRGYTVLSSYYTDVPPSYFDVLNWSNDKVTENSINLVLPIEYYGTGLFTWMRKDNDIPLSYFLKGSVLNLPNGNEYNTALIHLLSSDIRSKNYSDFVNLINTHGINFVYFDNNQNWAQWNYIYKNDINVPSSEDYSGLEAYLNRYPHASFGNISIHSTQPANEMIRVFDKNFKRVSDSDYRYVKLSPVHFQVFFNNSKDFNKNAPFNLNLNQSYDNGWVATEGGC